MAGRVSECQARLALMMAQLNQVACDSGQWLIAFARHTAPDPSEAQLGGGLISEVREQEGDHVERRDRLGRKKPFVKWPGPKSKPKMKAKAEAKGARKGKNEGKSFTGSGHRSHINRSGSCPRSFDPGARKSSSGLS